MRAETIAPDPVVAEYLDHLRYERGLAAATVGSYARDLARYQAFVTTRGAGVLSAGEDDVEAYFAGPGGAGAAATVARRVASLRGLYAYLVREELLAVDPTARLRTPRRGQDLPRVLSVEEVLALLARVVPAGPLGQRDLAMVELLYGCGLRASELLGLREGDVDLEAGLVRCTGKGDKERVVPMGGAAAAALVRYLRDGRRALQRGRRRAELFLNARGAPLTRQGLDYVLRRHLRAAGLPGRASAHTFRHSFATHLLAGGADLRSVQEMLGHANVATTQVYTHVTVEHLREVFLETHPRARRRRAATEGAGDAAARKGGAGRESGTARDVDAASEGGAA